MEQFGFLGVGMKMISERIQRRSRSKFKCVRYLTMRKIPATREPAQVSRLNHYLGVRRLRPEYRTRPEGRSQAVRSQSVLLATAATVDRSLAAGKNKGGEPRVYENRFVSRHQGMRRHGGLSLLEHTHKLARLTPRQRSVTRATGARVRKVSNRPRRG